MEAKWLKVACLADMLKPQRPYECQKETKGVEMVTQKNNHPPSLRRPEEGELDSSSNNGMNKEEFICYVSFS